MAVLAMLLIIWLVVVAEKIVHRRFWNKNLGLDIGLRASGSTAETGIGVTEFEADEGQSVSLSVAVSNAKLLPLPWVETKLQLSRNLWLRGEASLSDNYYQTDLFSVGPYQRITRRFKFICGKRGYYAIRGATLASRNLLSTEKLLQRTDCRCFLTVFPNRADTDRLEILYNTLYGSVAVRRFTNPDPFEFRGIRDYQPTDDVRLINHRATAKTNSLMVNVLSPTAAQRVDILLNFDSYSPWSRMEVFEESIRIAAGLAEDFTDGGFSVSLRTNGCDAVFESAQEISAGSGTQHAYRILEALARIDLKLPKASFADKLADIADTEPVYVLISACGDDDIEAGYRRLLNGGATVFWVMPVMSGDKPRLTDGSGILLWEVSPDEPVPEAG